jgi:hypothetical protein
MKIKNIVIACTVAALIATNLTASEQKKMPIDSVASAVSYDLLHVGQVYGDVYATSIVNTNGSRTFWNQSYNPNQVPKIGDLIAMVATNPFAFMIARPTNDAVDVYISYDSADGDQLFYADEGFMLTLSNGNWQIPVTAFTNMQTSLAYYEPIYEKGAVGARLNLRDANENILQTIWLDVYYTSSTRIGKIMNQTQYLGQHGELIVTYGQFDQYGNETNTYDVASWNGLVLQMAPPNIVLTNVPSNNHIGSSPLVEFTITNDTTVYFHADTSEGEVANGLTIKLLLAGQDLPKVPYSIPDGVAGISVLLPAGTYHIDFTWPLLTPAQIYPWYYYGNSSVTVTGKGG